MEMLVPTQKIKRLRGDNPHAVAQTFVKVEIGIGQQNLFRMKIS